MIYAIYALNKMKLFLNTLLFVFIVVSTAGAQFADHRFVDHQFTNQKFSDHQLADRPFSGNLISAHQFTNHRVSAHPFSANSASAHQFSSHQSADHHFSSHSASKYATGRWSLTFSAPGSNDNGNEVREEPKPGRINLSGPRFGLTLVTGRLADRLDEDFDAMPVITQFGWQFERQFIGRDDGVQTLSEFVVLVGGAEQGLLLPSVSWLVGVRNSSGTEFGVGPNVSVAGASLVFAFGVTHSTETLNFPINFAIAPSSEGMRFSILVGFNARD